MQSVGQASFGDKRLNKRFGQILTRLSHTYGSIPASMHGAHETKAFYRFINHHKVTTERIVSSYVSGVVKHPFFKDNRLILGIQDTTELLYTGNRSAKNLDCLNQHYQKGLFLDTLLVATPMGIPFGFSHISFYARKAESLGKQQGQNRHYVPPEQRESYRWLVGFKTFASYFETLPDKQGIYIADREADMFPMFEAGESYSNVKWVIRSKHNRVLVSGDKFYDFLAAAPKRGERLIHFYNPQRIMRSANLDIRYEPVQFRDTRTRKISPVLYVVEARELEPPEEEEAVCWRILTNMPVENLATAEQILDYYVQRWLIERFFYVLKKGFLQVEDLQIEQADALQNAILLKLHQALSIMNLHKLAQADPEQDLSVSEFGQEDYDLAHAYVQTHYYKNIQRKDKPTVFDFALLLAMLVGEKPTAKKLGLIRLSKGYEKFVVIKNAYIVAQKLNDNHSRYG
jgi:hypothetical protein